MAFILHNPTSVPAPIGGYSLGLEAKAGARLLFISGQIPESPEGTIPPNFEAQCELVWQNIESVLRAAAMDVTNLVKVTTFLTDQSQAESNGQIRRRHLGATRPALTVIVAQTLDAQWLLEIEAIAMAES